MGRLTYTTQEVQDRLDAVGTLVRPNLLDNAYFVGGGSQQGNGQFPINQRGQTSYPNVGYTIDRWRQLPNGGLSVGSGGVTIANTYLSQLYEDLQTGTYTLSALIDNALYTVSGKIQKNASDIQASFANLSISANYHETYINIGTAMTVQAAKLELGDTQTLAHQENGAWVLNKVPNYQQELAKCQRYFVNLNVTNSIYPNFGGNVANNSTVAYIPIELPVPMRTVPSISLTNTIGTYYLTNGPTQYTLTNMTMDSFMGSRLKIACKTTGLTTSQFYSLETMSAESIMLSADL